jgi:RNA polymerase sigma factor (sigma-70 family)
MRGHEEFQDFYEAEFSGVFRAAYCLAGNTHVAEDATQEAFARALERWHRVRLYPRVTGWVTVTALNEVRRALRRRPSAQDTAPPDTDTDSSIVIWQAVRSLPPRQQEALVLHYILDLSLEDAAQVMGCRNGTVKSHLARARKAMAQAIGGTYE